MACGHFAMGIDQPAVPFGVASMSWKAGDMEGVRAMDVWGTWLSDYVPEQFGEVFLDERLHKRQGNSQQRVSTIHSMWEGREAGLGGMSMKLIE